MGKLIFVTGGTHSGKTDFARNLANQYEDVAYIETAMPVDEVTTEIIARNRADAPADWLKYDRYKSIGTLILEKRHRLFIIDCIYMIIVNLLNELDIDWDNIDSQALRKSEEKVLEHIDGITAAVCACDSVVIVVTNELGLGMSSDSKLHVAYRNLCGQANQILARFADEAYMMISGFAQKIK